MTTRDPDRQTPVSGPSHSSRPIPNGLEERRRAARWDGLSGVLAIAERETPCTVVGEPSWTHHGVERLALRVESRMIPGDIEYRNDARVSVSFGGEPAEDVVFGPVESVEWQNGAALVTVVTAFVELSEVVIDGASYWGRPPGTVSSIFGALLGVNADLDLPLAGSDDVVYVTCAIDGLQPDSTFTVGQVIFTGDHRVADLGRMDGTDPALLDQFVDASCWATAIVAGKADHQARVRGVHLIDCAVAWIMLAHSLGLSTFQGHEHMAFHRRWVRSRPTRRTAILACGDRSGQCVLTGGVSAAEGPSLGDPTPRRLPQLAWQLANVRLLAALLAWRRAVDSEDRFTACSALCEAVECVVSKTTMKEPAFTEDDLEAIRTGIPQGLTEGQAKRVEQMVGGLNEPPLMAKVRAFAERNGVGSEGDFSAFHTVRTARNNMVHGRGKATVEWSDVNQVRGWVAQLVAAAILSEPSSQSPPPGLLRVRQ